MASFFGLPFKSELVNRANLVTFLRIQNKITATKTRNAKIFDFLGIHPHIQKVSKKKHYENCVRYHYKQAEPYTNIELELKDRRAVYKIRTLNFELENEEEDLEEIDFGALDKQTEDPINFDVKDFIKNSKYEKTKKEK